MFSPVDVIKVDFLVVDVLELDVLGGAPDQTNPNQEKTS
jgi:hypothetical protein